MRADRLLATLLILQARGSVTAREVADELEISERTARRDLDALSVAGVPVFSKQGRGGGWELVGGARTDLTGLRSAEARALLTMAAASGRATPDFVSAMRKLVQALPETMRGETERVMASIVADDTTWGNRSESLLVEPRRDEWLEPLQEAVIDNIRLQLTYDTPRKGSSQRWIEPLGLIIKQGHWYVLAMTEAGRRSFRVDRITGLEPTGERFEPPPSFDLDAEWESVTSGYIENSMRVTVEALVDPSVLGPLRAMGVETVVEPSDTFEDRTRATLGAWNARVLAVQISGLMGGIELIEPPVEVTESLAAIGAELVERFGGGDVGRFVPPTER